MSSSTCSCALCQSSWFGGDNSGGGSGDAARPAADVVMLQFAQSQPVFLPDLVQTSDAGLLAQSDTSRKSVV